MNRRRTHGRNRASGQGEPAPAARARRVRERSPAAHRAWACLLASCPRIWATARVGRQDGGGAERPATQASPDQGDVLRRGSTNEPFAPSDGEAGSGAGGGSRAWEQGEGGVRIAPSSGGSLGSARGTPLGRPPWRTASGSRAANAAPTAQPEPDRRWRRRQAAGDLRRRDRLAEDEPGEAERENTGSTFMIAELPTTPSFGSTVNMIVNAVPYRKVSAARPDQPGVASGRWKPPGRRRDGGDHGDDRHRRRARRSRPSRSPASCWRDTRARPKVARRRRARRRRRRRSGATARSRRGPTRRRTRRARGRGRGKHHRHRQDDARARAGSRSRRRAQSAVQSG